MLFSTLVKKFVGAGCACGLLAGALLVSPLAVAEEAVYPAKPVMVQDMGNGSLKMLTPHAFYQGPDGRTVELIGAVHLGEKQYYKDLENIFRQCDKVLFEMVGGENIPRMGELQRKIKSGQALTKAEQEEMERMMEKAKKDLEESNVFMKLLGPMYASFAKMMGMVSQKDGIDYFAHESFVHADMSRKELDDALEKHGKSFLSDALSMSDMQKKMKNQSEFDPMAILAAAMAGNYRYVKGEVIKLFGSMDAGASRGKWSVILDGRNEKCFAVFDQVNKDKANKRIGIFYGSAHLTGMHQMLMDRGYAFQKVEWLVAWDTDAKP